MFLFAEFFHNQLQLIVLSPPPLQSAHIPKETERGPHDGTYPKGAGHRGNKVCTGLPPGPQPNRRSWFEVHLEINKKGN